MFYLGVDSDGKQRKRLSWLSACGRIFCGTWLSSFIKFVVTLEAYRALSGWVGLIEEKVLPECQGLSYILCRPQLNFVSLGSQGGQVVPGRVL